MSKDIQERIKSEYSDMIVNTEDTVEFIPTGSLSLDLAIGGGIPTKRFIEIYGPEGSGKTTLVLGICREALKLGHSVMYVDAEHGVDISLVKSIMGDNYDEERFILMQPDTMERGLSLCEEAIISGKYKIVVVDSIAALTPKKVLDDDLDDANVALLASRLKIFLQRNMFTVRKNGIAFIGINQVRDKIGSYFKTFHTPGGHAWKHVASVIVELGWPTAIDKEDKEIGINTRFVVKKNKVNIPFRTFTIPILFGKGIDYYRDTIDFASTIGILIKRGPYYKLEEDVLASGMNNTIEYLKSNPDTLDKIVEMCYNVMGLSKETEEIE